MARTPGAIRTKRPLVGGRRCLGVRDQARVAEAQRVEERAVRTLRPVGKRARQRVDEDEGSAIADRERIAPLPKSETEDDACGRDRVERLAWYVRTHPWDTHHDRIELIVEARSAQLDRANERFRVRDRGRAGEDCGRREDATLVAQDAASHGPGKQRVETPERRTRDVLESCFFVGVAAEPAGESRMVEHQRDGQDADPRGNRRLDRERQLPDRFASRLHERTRRRRRVGSSPRRRPQAARPGHRGRRSRLTRPRATRSASTTAGLMRASAVIATRSASAASWTTTLPVERARLRRRKEPLELLPPDLSCESSCDEERDVLVTRRRWLSSWSSTVASATGRGSICAPGSGSAGGSTTTVTRIPRRANSARGPPESGNASASRTAAATSTTRAGGAGGRRITSSAPTGTVTIREPERSGTPAMSLSKLMATPPSAAKRPLQGPARSESAIADSDLRRKTRVVT